MALSVPDQISQLEAAHQIVLSDPQLYLQIVEGVLPIVGISARPELRRWGADFLAETLASPVVPSAIREKIAVTSLGILKDYLELSGEDIQVVKSTIQASASVYGVIFKFIIQNPSDRHVWDIMAAIKSNILRRWDTALTSIKVCCLKFAQQVVQVQTPGLIADPRRPEKNETSISLVPRDHPLIPPSRLEPEASGLLDRLLDVFHESSSNAILIDATLNCMAILLRARQSIANRIISAILNFNPLKQANSPMTPTAKVQIKSMERTTRALLMNVYRRNETAPLAARIKAYVDRMTQSRMEIFDEAGARKRGHQTEPTDGLDHAKRRRLDADIPMQRGAQLKPGGPNTLGEVFTLTNDATLATFDVAQLPAHLVATISAGLLVHISQSDLENALNAVRSRLLSLAKTGPISTVPGGALGDDEEDYEPDFEPSEDREQILNRADALPPEDDPYQPEISLGSFELSQPLPLTTTEVNQVGKGTIGRVFELIGTLDEVPSAKKHRPAFNKTAGSNYDRDSWITVLTRLATRATAGLDDNVEPKGNGQLSMELTRQGPSLSDTIRDNLFEFVLENFRSRIHIAISWLNEEWYNDKIRQRAHAESSRENKPLRPPTFHYESSVLRVLDGIMPYLDAKDKLLIRFLSEIPEVGEQVLQRVKKLADDPERVDLCVKALQYLIMLKPPARSKAIDAVEDLWRNNEDTKIHTTKILQKWRPEILPPPLPKAIPSSITITSSKSEVPDSEAQNSTIVDPVHKGEGDLRSPSQAGLPVAAAG